MRGRRAPGKFCDVKAVQFEGLALILRLYSYYYYFFWLNVLYFINDVMAFVFFHVLGTNKKCITCQSLIFGSGGNSTGLESLKVWEALA